MGNNVCSVSENFDDLFGEEIKLGDGELKHISNLVAQARTQEAYVALCEEKLAHQKEILRVLLEVTLPEALHSVGMADIGLADGSRVKVEPFHHGRITEATKDAAHAWLDENGFGGMIKRDITVSFGRDADGADGLTAYIREMGLASNEKTAVHSSTLNAFIRDQASKGTPVDQELFNVYSGHRTKFVKP